MPTIQSLDRALRILDLFDEATPELKLTEISGRIGLHKSTVHSLLKTLQEHGYIEQDAETGKYKLGLKLLERGQLLLQSLDLRAVAHKALWELTMRTGQTTHLVVRDGREGVYIDKVEGEKAVIRYSRVGRRIPIHCSAVGKALAAFLGTEELAAVLAGYEYRRHTPHTLSSERQFLAELAKVREQGYAVDNEENEPGVRCVAAPIRDHAGQVAAAVSISTLTARVDDGQLAQLTGLLTEAAARISRQLGYDAPAVGN